MKINRQILESFLGKKVEVELHDGIVMKGFLNKCSFYGQKNWYTIIPCHRTILFRVSHLTRIKEVKYNR